eukprot:g1437.t1
MSRKEKTMGEKERLKEFGKFSKPLTASSGLNRRHQQARLKRVALQFLSNIYMHSETVQDQDSLLSYDNERKQSSESGADVLLPSPGIILAQNKNQQADKISIRLRGKKFKYTKHPPMLKNKNYNWVLSQWRKDAIKSGLLDSRVFMSYSKAYPTLCYSIKPYKSNNLKGGSVEQKERSKRLKRSKDVNRFGKILSKRFGKGLAYGHMLCTVRFDNDYSNKTNRLYEKFLNGRLGLESDEDENGDARMEYIINRNQSEWYKDFCRAWQHERESQREREKLYNAYYIDDPRLRQGARKTVITKLGPMYTFSVIRYANQKTLKNELNEDFGELHPWIPPSLTLSKIRNLKRETLEYWKKQDLEISTLALAVVYFEKLIMRKLVIKSNRKLKFATCLLLAFKFNESTMIVEDDNVNQAIKEEQDKNQGNEKDNDSVGDVQILLNSKTNVNDINKKSANNIFEAAQQIYGIGRKEIIKNEMQVFSELSFGLFTNPTDVVHHFNRLLHTIELRPEQYLTSEGFLFWRNTTGEDRQSRIEEGLQEEDVQVEIMYVGENKIV